MSYYMKSVHIISIHLLGDSLTNKKVSIDWVPSEGTSPGKRKFRAVSTVETLGGAIRMIESWSFARGYFMGYLTLVG